MSVEQEKILVVPDVHGRREQVDQAYKMLKEGDCSKVIFLGDFCDSFDASNTDILYCVIVAMAMKRTHPDNVVLLYGNHDFQYAFKEFAGVCSGFREGYIAQALRETFEDSRELWQVAYQTGKHLFTHAGVTNGWYFKHHKLIESVSEAGDCTADRLNKLLLTEEGRKALYEVGRARGGVRGSRGGPMWSDMVESIIDAFIGFEQYVGHTEIAEAREDEPAEDTKIHYLDTWKHKKELYLFEVGAEEVETEKCQTSTDISEQASEEKQ